MPVPAGGNSAPPPGAYASIDDLTDKLGKTPLNADQLLIRASRDVDRALLCAVYDTADLGIVATLREAVLEQIAAGLDAGDMTGSGVSKGGGFSIGRLTVQAPASGSAGTARKVGPLWEQAWSVLQQAGLTGFGPQAG